ncbi:MAG: UDP-2,4-diacetamido-2,4,6-trideoxy-beta-L-altropyranose hydrolase [Trueperaceae bacterium]|nr:UDP-2,4-diacetamido-2,4,6-trideoxy-beta-L-altropyranose hydrolase [Trueperaceae bacterium]
MRVAIRADAGHHIGLGHVMRCSHLADELHQRGHTPRFVSKTHAGHAVDLLKERGFHVHDLPARMPHSSDISTWLGATPDEDARESQEALRAIGSVDWLIVDHYGVDARWHRAMRSVAERILVVDDLADRPLDADVVVNQNLGFDEADYADLVPSTSRFLVGPRYALLDRAYAAARRDARPKTAAPNEAINLLVSLGGSDPKNLTGQLLQAIERLFYPFDTIDVVISRQHPERSAFFDRWSRHEHLRVHVQPPSLVRLLAAADLAVGAGGSSTWERLCMAVPTVMVVSAENQRAIARTMAARNLAIVVEDPLEMADDLRAQLAALAFDAHRRQAMATSGVSMVDGYGTRRVADVMERLA